MICCKIIADYKQQCLEFGNIFTELNKIGNVLWNNSNFYFANITDSKVTEKNVRKIFKKHGCKDIFIEIYDKTFQPRNDDYTDHWIEDKLIKIGFIEFENNQQETIQNISKQLNDIDLMLTQYKSKTEKH